MKVPPRGATHHLGGPGVGGARERDHSAGAERGCRANERAHVARVLDGIEHEDTGQRRGRKRGKRHVGDIGDAEHTLRAVRVGRGFELRVGDGHALDATRAERGHEVCVAVGGVGRDQGAPQRNAGAQGLAHHARALGHERRRALPRLAPLEVAGKG